MSKSLVVYFSVYGTAKNMAEIIAKQTGADLVEIEPLVPYDSNRDHYNQLAKLAKQEHDSNARPAIKNEIPVQDYDTIFVGYPMWWYTFPMILYTSIPTWVPETAELTARSSNWSPRPVCSTACPWRCAAQNAAM